MSVMIGKPSGWIIARAQLCDRELQFWELPFDKIGGRMKCGDCQGLPMRDVPERIFSKAQLALEMRNSKGELPDYVFAIWDQSVLA